ncbi:exonuclease SbcCD subunit D [Streptomyces iranensis]|uniref:Nuclease SbcCD subunit D n=1 Tax=Streptomyces iranensis TaxID=576784 RepID=A0A060ZMU2_9ACTN|nr:exonuclease SbcCD subunit D [Streptomyces iranensis]MBP2062680.1 exonuclease SbcD [Streptomyces iranensis]CDR04501.1 nuclease SbcCD, D subunit [Streptomyces iranensis]
MRILHTSDWHLGRSFHRVSLLAAQREFIDHLVTTVREGHIDAVVVAGDIYDRAVPPLAAVELFDDALHRLADLGVPTVMISGNHDSARRLGVGAGLIDRAGIHLRTDPAGCATPVVLSHDRGEVAFYGLPYLEPGLVREELGASAAGHTAVLGAAMDRVRADLATRQSGTRSVVLAHAFVTGGAVSDSERDITVGGVASVPAEVFDGVDYAALGHLHGCQTITERVRYSGSPLAYSFSEAAHRKSMWVVELGAAGEAPSCERVECPVPRPLARIRGRIEELLADPDLERHEEAWVEATLTDAVRPHEPMARLARRFPHVLTLVFDPERPPEDPLASYAQRLRGRSDRQIAEDFVAHVRGGRGPDETERALLGDALEAVRSEAHEGVVPGEESGAGSTAAGPVTAGATAGATAGEAAR